MAHAALPVEGRDRLGAGYLPRVATTAFTGTPGSTWRITAATMSPPWLTSATSASAFKPR